MTIMIVTICGCQPNKLCSSPSPENGFSKFYFTYTSPLSSSNLTWLVINECSEHTFEIFSDKIILGTWQIKEDTLTLSPSVQICVETFPLKVETIDSMNMDEQNSPQTLIINKCDLDNVSDYSVLWQCLLKQWRHKGIGWTKEEGDSTVIPEFALDSWRGSNSYSTRKLHNPLIKDVEENRDSAIHRQMLLPYKQLKANNTHQAATLLLRSDYGMPNVYVNSCPISNMAISGQWNVYGDTLVLNPQLEYRCENGRYSFVSLDTVPDVRNEAVERYLIKKTKLLNISDTARVRRALERLPWKPTCLGGNSYKFRK